MQKLDTILVTGGQGMLGRHIIDCLRSQGYENIISPRASKTDDFTDPEVVARYFDNPKPDYVFHCAAKVSGLGGNIKDQHGAFLTNLRINTNVIEAAVKAKVKKIIAMGTGAVYPDLETDNMEEKIIWLGPPHESEYGYAQAKRAMLAQLDITQKQFGMDYAFAVNANLYGPYDRFNVETGHVVPSLIRKFYESIIHNKKFVMWGRGTDRRDFMHAGDAARALVLIMNNISGAINIGSGEIKSIYEIFKTLKAHIGSVPELEYDLTKPMAQRLRSYDLSKLKALDFVCEYNFERGIASTYDWYVANAGKARE